MDTLIAEYLGHIRPTYSAHTVKDRQTLLVRLDRELPYGIAEVATEDLEEWMVGLGCRPPSWTLCTYYRTLRSAYGWWFRTGRIDFDPTAALAKPRQPDPIPHPATDEQVAQALTMPRPWSTAVLLAGYGGLRCGEICRLTWDEVTADWILVHGKGGRTRTVPTGELIRTELLIRGEGRSGPVLAHRDGRPFLPNYLTTAVSQRLAVLGMPGVTLHWFRHWYATTLLTGGVDIRTVQELLGHRQVTTTQVYTAVTDRQRRNAIATLPVLRNPLQAVAA